MTPIYLLLFVRLFGCLCTFDISRWTLHLVDLLEPKTGGHPSELDPRNQHIENILQRKQKIRILLDLSILSSYTLVFI